MAELEITKMLTISTIHVKEETCKWLYEVFEEQQPYDPVPPFYPKGEYGFFVYCDSESVDNAITDENCPEDLTMCMVFAFVNGCELLCLDCDGPIIEGLRKYKWS